MFREGENIRLVRLIRSFLCLGRVRTYETRKTCKTYKSFPLFGESKNIRLVRLIRLIRSFLCSGRVRI